MKNKQQFLTLFFCYCYYSIVQCVRTLVYQVIFYCTMSRMGEFGFPHLSFSIVLLCQYWRRKNMRISKVKVVNGREVGGNKRDLDSIQHQNGQLMPVVESIIYGIFYGRFPIPNDHSFLPTIFY